MGFSIDDTVKLESFLGTRTPPHHVSQRQDYWKLVGHCGRILRQRKIARMAFEESELQLLVQFGDEVDGYGLHSHNEEKNSFWIVSSDLSLVPLQTSA